METQHANVYCKCQILPSNTDRQTEEETVRENVLSGAAQNLKEFFGGNLLGGLHRGEGGERREFSNLANNIMWGVYRSNIFDKFFWIRNPWRQT